MSQTQHILAFDVLRLYLLSADRNLYSSDTIMPDYFPSPEYE